VFTGLPGAGKSTLASALAAMLREGEGRRVTLLDGDAVGRLLSSERGFSREHREINLRRVGFVAGEVTGHGGIAVCALIAPYAASRRELRRSIETIGGFVKVHVSTPLGTCEARDPKGLYAKARAGLIGGLTGIDDPWEPPENPDVEIDTTDIPPDLAVRRVLAKLGSLGYIRQARTRTGAPAHVPDQSASHPLAAQRQPAFPCGLRQTHTFDNRTFSVELVCSGLIICVVIFFPMKLPIYLKNTANMPLAVRYNH